MKKTIYTFAILTSVLFASCNNKLNDDIDDLEGTFSDLQAENAAIQAELDNVSGNLADGGLDVISPVKGNHEYTNDGDTTSEVITFLSSKSFYAEYNNYSSQKSEAISIISPTYTHTVIMDFNTVDGNEMYLNFRYNSDTKEVTLQRFYLETFNQYYNSYPNSTGVENTLTVNSFDTATGEISIDFEMEFDNSYSYSSNDSGKVSFSFNDTLEYNSDFNF